MMYRMCSRTWRRLRTLLIARGPWEAAGTGCQGSSGLPGAEQGPAAWTSLAFQLPEEQPCLLSEQHHQWWPPQ